MPMKLLDLASAHALRAVILRALLFAILWWILAEGAWHKAWLGAGAVVLALVCSLVAWPPGRVRVSASGLVAFLAFFLWESLRSGLAVARLALRPRLHLHPEMRALSLRLPPGAPRVLLANTLSLLPGTLSVGLEGDTLHLHVLDAGLVEDTDLRAAEHRVARLLRSAK